MDGVSFLTPEIGATMMAGFLLLISLIGIAMFMLSKTLKATIAALLMFAVSLLALQSIGHNGPMVPWAESLYDRYVFAYTIGMITLLMAKCFWLIARNLFLNPKKVEDE